MTVQEPAWVADVLDFWFQELSQGDWFAKSAELDDRIRARFLALHERLQHHDGQGLDGARPLLAAVIVLDQFSRNLFRGAARAFDCDPLARELARQAIARGFDRALTDRERVFLYLPFEHSEDRDDQALSVELISRLGNEHWTRYAEAHKTIIDRFGRFPHRNAVLGRASTEEEAEMLRQPMSSF